MEWKEDTGYLLLESREQYKMVEELEILQEEDSLKEEAKNYYLNSIKENDKEDIFRGSGTEILLDENSDQLYLFYRDHTKMIFVPICYLNELSEGEKQLK